MEDSLLLGTKPLVDSIRHFIRDPSSVFSVCHLCECRIVQWRHDSRLLLLLNWFFHIIKEHYTLARRYESYVLVARTISHSFAVLTREILFLPLEHKIHIFSPPCNILYIIIIRTFPESFAAGKSSISNNLVSLRAARPLRCVEISLTIN